MQIAHQPSIYVLDTPGVLVPSIPNIEMGLKLAFAGQAFWTSSHCHYGSINSQELQIQILYLFFALTVISTECKSLFDLTLSDSKLKMMWSICCHIGC